MRWFFRVKAKNMKCAVVFIFVSLALTSQTFAVLRPRFPVKTMPPFHGDVIVIGDDLFRGPPKDTVPK